MKNSVKFIITALIILGGIMAYKNYQDGGFENAKGVNTPIGINEDNN